MESIYVLATDLGVLTVVLVAFFFLRDYTRRYVREKKIVDPPYVRLIIVYITIACIFWYIIALILPSTEAGLGVAILHVYLIAPVAMFIIIVKSPKDKHKSRLHYAVYIFSIVYFSLFVAFCCFLLSQLPKPKGGPP
jgi:amino acid transporter